MAALLTPRQVAESLGVSESSLKRWCDNGELDVTRTPGGHRRLSLDAVIRFLRSGSRQLVKPEAIGLPKHIGVGRLSSENHASDFYEAVLQDDFFTARRIVFDLYLRSRPLSVVLDEVVATTMHRVGDEWKSGSISIQQEHRVFELVMRVVRELQRLLPLPPEQAPLAIGAAAGGDMYTLPTLMVETVLTDQGWRAMSMGCNLPLSSLLTVARDRTPSTLWLSVSELVDRQQFLEDYASFYAQLPRSVAVVVGGRALTADVRAEMRYASHCENLQQIVEFANALHHRQQASSSN